MNHITDSVSSFVTNFDMYTLNHITSRPRNFQTTHLNKSECAYCLGKQVHNVASSAILT